MPRFVILTHNHPHLHWDFMLEWGDVLRTWRLETGPKPGCDIKAEPLANHRIVYLDYEGPVSGDRGEVRRWDAGNYEVLSETKTELVVELRGDKVCGRAAITRSETESAPSTFALTAD